MILLQKIADLEINFIAIFFINSVYRNFANSQFLFLLYFLSGVAVNIWGFAKLRYTLNIKKNDKSSISRSAGSWGKVKIPFCRHFDVVFGKIKIFSKISIFKYFLIEKPSKSMIWFLIKIKSLILKVFQLKST